MYENSLPSKSIDYRNKVKLQKKKTSAKKALIFLKAVPAVDRRLEP